MTVLPLYIDPGTGSMLFSLFIALATTAVFGFRAAIIKVKMIFGRGKQAELDKSHLGIVIFSDSKRYWNVFAPIAREFESRKLPLTYYTQSADDPALGEKFEFVKTEFIGEGNKGLTKMNFLNADICLSTTPGLDVYQWKRSRNCDFYVHILHMVSDPTTYRMFGLDFYDAVLLSGEYQVSQIRTLEKMRGLSEKELVTVGCTYLDAMRSRLASQKNANQLTKNSGKKTTVLLAPSWGESAILSRYGDDILSVLVQTGFNIIIRPHPQSFTSEKEMLAKLQKKYPDSDTLFWDTSNDNFEVLSMSDVLITDFSGVIFDYALVFDGPVIYADTNFDSSPYDAAWIDDDLWTFKILPSLGKKLERKDFQNLKNIIEFLISDKQFSSGRECARNAAWVNLGNAASKTVDYLLSKIEKKKSEA